MAARKLPRRRSGAPPENRLTRRRRSPSADAVHANHTPWKRTRPRAPPRRPWLRSREPARGRRIPPRVCGPAGRPAKRSSAIAVRPSPRGLGSSGCRAHRTAYRRGARLSSGTCRPCAEHVPQARAGPVPCLLSDDGIVKTIVGLALVGQPPKVDRVIEVFTRSSLPFPSLASRAPAVQLGPFPRYRNPRFERMRTARLGAEPAHAPRRVVARKRRQVDAGHGLYEPRRLPFLLDRPARGQRRGAALDRARIDADALEPVSRERRARVAGRAMALAEERFQRRSFSTSLS